VKYMLLVYEPGDRPRHGTPEGEAITARHRAFRRECERRGVLVAADPLHPTEDATTVSLDDGRPIVSDGPFAETREWLAGYYLLDCPSREQAHELAAMVPSCADGGKVEVRPVVDLH
jgi:hypothetical protein